MAEGQQQKPKTLLDQVREVLRLHHYAIRTEQAYCEWVRRFVKFHGMQSRADLADGTRKVEASTQNQALAVSFSKLSSMVDVF